MIGLKREEHWSFSNYLSVKNEQEFIATEGLSDENGNINKEMPQSKWKVDFRSLEKKKCLVEIEITCNDLAQLKSTLDMGFKDGFTKGLGNLDVYLAGHQK